MYVFKKVNQVAQRDFKCKLSSWARGGLAKQGTWMVCLYYVLYWFPSRDPANLQIKYRINWSCFPFYVQPISKWHFTHKEYNKQYPETYLDEIYPKMPNSGCPTRFFLQSHKILEQSQQWNKECSNAEVFQKTCEGWTKALTKSQIERFPLV